MLRCALGIIVNISYSNHYLKDDTMLQLLHTGAHNYKTTPNVEQTIAISIILGAMLMITHKK